MQLAIFFGKRRFIGMADGSIAHCRVLEQAFDDLHGHIAIQAVKRLGRGVAEHVEDSFGICRNGLSDFVGVEHDLCAAQHSPNDHC